MNLESSFPALCAPTCFIHSRENKRAQKNAIHFQEKTSNWEFRETRSRNPDDLPGELTVPQTDTGEQVEYTRALERTMSKELGKMTP